MATNAEKLDPDGLRTRFVVALSEMYRGEVSLYGKLLDIVHHVDQSVLAAEGKSPASLPIRHELERHGAIRLGTEHELHTIRRLFGILGMYPVGYYDLGVVNFPLHATAFRPITEKALEKNPFRVFTTLLLKDRLSSKTRTMVEGMLNQRDLFTKRLLGIIHRVESSGLITAQDADDLINDALKIFKFHSRSNVSLDQYLMLKREHPMAADIACFPSAHINHLTPRTLDIGLVQAEMIRQGMPAKDRIEGPPARKCPILLRQTSFKALEEHVVFAISHGSSGSVQGTHTARFGEVEQRGAAVTPKGRALYDRLLSLARHAAAGVDGAQPKDFDTLLAEYFSSHYPDSWSDLRAQRLVYFRYQVTALGRHSPKVSSLRGKTVSVEDLLSLGLIEYEPVVYEDFLPFSAAGIFKSNVDDGVEVTSDPAEPPGSSHKGRVGPENRAALESALGCQVLDEFELYAALERDSVKKCAKDLDLRGIVMA